MVGKLLKIILPDKIENRKAEVHKQALDLSPGYSDFRCSCIIDSFNYIPSILALGKQNLFNYFSVVAFYSSC